MYSFTFSEFVNLAVVIGGFVWNFAYLSANLKNLKERMNERDKRFDRLEQTLQAALFRTGGK